MSNHKPFFLVPLCSAVWRQWQKALHGRNSVVLVCERVCEDVCVCESCLRSGWVVFVSGWGVSVVSWASACLRTTSGRVFEVLLSVTNRSAKTLFFFFLLKKKLDLFLYNKLEYSFKTHLWDSFVIVTLSGALCPTYWWSHWTKVSIPMFFSQVNILLLTRSGPLIWTLRQYERKDKTRPLVLWPHLILCRHIDPFQLCCLLFLAVCTVYFCSCTSRSKTPQWNFVYFATTTDSSWWYNWGKQESIEHKSLSGQ